ncbi:MAG: glycerophosphodiester phosphodiesterase family protein [Roseobacter sp.]
MSPPLPEAFLKAPLAHRGLHDVKDGRPENSGLAIRAACDAGYGIEIDVQLSADHQAMVFHDYDLARLAAADGPLRDLSAADLGQLRLRGADAGIPTLVEILDIVSGQVPLLIEIKDQDGAMGPNIGPLENSVAQALAAYDGEVAVMSFNPNAVMRMAELLPQIARGLVTCRYGPEERLPVTVRDRLRGIPDYDAAGCSFISHDCRDLDRPRVVALKAAGARILCWTVKSSQEEARARKIAENITFEQYLAPIPA